MLQIADVTRQRAGASAGPHGGACVSAATGRSTLEYGLVRMFEAHSEDVDTQVRVFHTTEEAVTWLTG